MKVVFIYANGQRFYENVKTRGGHSFDMGDFMRVCQRHLPALGLELDKRGLKAFYIIRCQSETSDNVMRANGMWTSYAMHRGLPYVELRMFGTEDAAQAQIDEVAESMGDTAQAWALSYEEYGE